MAKKVNNKAMLLNDPYYGDFSLDVLRLSHHATQRAVERKIPATELLQSRSHINAYVDKVVSKSGVIITTYPRQPYIAPIPDELPENGRRFTFPKNGIGIFIGKQHVNIKRTQTEYNLITLYFDKSGSLIAVPPSADYNWTMFENMLEKAQKRKYKTPQQLLAKKNEQK
ncbi:hypothetical protein I4U23_015763 [Adineta vaga]|nr:hypothetical protein I4U23_015763 [Adineta vaga]